MAELLAQHLNAQSGALQYLALGDSYTIGEGVADPGRWPLQLAAALRADGIPLQDPRIIARTGWTTDELQAAIAEARPSPDYDLVSLLIGVNNQYRGRDLDEYREQFTALLEQARDLARGCRGRVLVLSIPDWGVTPFAVNQGRDPEVVGTQIDAFNQVAREVCAARGVAFVDITPVSRTLGGAPLMLAEDGLHPSAAMYAEWTRLALPWVRMALEARV